MNSDRVRGQLAAFVAIVGSVWLAARRTLGLVTPLFTMAAAAGAKAVWDNAFH